MKGSQLGSVTIDVKGNKGDLGYGVLKKKIYEIIFKN
jgi:hypothetical protein